MFKRILILSATLFIGNINPVRADLFNPEPDILLDIPSYSFTHNILDEGYDPATNMVDSANLTLTFQDVPLGGVGDGVFQSVDIYLDGVFNSTVGELSGGGTITDIINIGNLDQLADGLLNVSLVSSQGAELHFDSSQLDVSYLTPVVTHIPVLPI